MKKVYYMFLAILLISNVSYGGSLIKMSGSNTLGLYFGDIDNKAYKTVFTEEFAENLNLKEKFLLQGKAGSFDFNGLGDIYFNKEKSININRMILELSKDNLTINLGDVYSQQTLLSLYNLKVQGAGFKYTYKLEKEKIALKNTEPLLKAVLLNKKADIKYGFTKSYRTDSGKRSFIYNILEKIVFMGNYGISNDFFSSTSDTEGEPPNQLLFNFRTDFHIDDTMKIGLSFVQASDANVDISSKYYTQIKKGNSYSADLSKVKKNILQTNDRLEVLAEFGKSEYDDSKNDTTPSKDADAYRLNLEYEFGKYQTELKYYYYDEDFKTLGNPYMVTDKKGVYANFMYSEENKYNYGFNIEKYRNNLNGDATDSTVTTTILEPSVYFYLGKYPDLSMRYVSTIEDGKVSDISDKGDLYLTLSGAVLKEDRIKYVLTYTNMDYEDKIETDSNSYKNNALNISLNYYLFKKQLIISNNIYTDKMKYRSNNFNKNFYWTFTCSYQFTDEKTNLNAVLNGGSSKNQDGYTSKTNNAEIEIKHLLSYKSALSFNTKFMDESYPSNPENDLKAYVIGVDYSINF